MDEEIEAFKRKWKRIWAAFALFAFLVTVCVVLFLLLAPPP